jgi:hypothetical protein
MIRKNLSKLLRKITFSDKNRSASGKGRNGEIKPALMPSDIIRLRNMRKRLGKD